jgi:hypothetical protein
MFFHGSHIIVFTPDKLTYVNNFNTASQKLRIGQAPVSMLNMEEVDREDGASHPFQVVTTR